MEPPRVRSFIRPSLQSQSGIIHMRAVFAVCLLFLVSTTACNRAAPPAEPTPAQTPTPPSTPAPEPATPAAHTQGYAVELEPQQTEADLRSAAEDVFADVVSVERLFPDVDPDVDAGDDPEGLSRIWRVRVADPVTSGAISWDQAYALQERGGFVRVEPDTEDTLVEA